MPQYLFTISRGDQTEPGVASHCPDDDSAMSEAVGIFVDMARGIGENLRSQIRWQVALTDDRGKSIFKINVASETSE